MDSDSRSRVSCFDLTIIVFIISEKCSCSHDNNMARPFPPPLPLSGRATKKNVFAASLKPNKNLILDEKMVVKIHLKFP